MYSEFNFGILSVVQTNNAVVSTFNISCNSTKQVSSLVPATNYTVIGGGTLTCSVHHFMTLPGALSCHALYVSLLYNDVYNITGSDEKSVLIVAPLLVSIGVVVLVVTVVVSISLLCIRRKSRRQGSYSTKPRRNTSPEDVNSGDSGVSLSFLPDTNSSSGELSPSPSPSDSEDINSSGLLSGGDAANSSASEDSGHPDANSTITGHLNSSNNEHSDHPDANPNTSGHFDVNLSGLPDTTNNNGSDEINRSYSGSAHQTKPMNRDARFGDNPGTPLMQGQIQGGVQAVCPPPPPPFFEPIQIAPSRWLDPPPPLFKKIPLDPPPL
jgi:hypothetical protein